MDEMPWLGVYFLFLLKCYIRIPVLMFSEKLRIRVSDTRTRIRAA
jgi:hypothetical protein